MSLPEPSCMNCIHGKPVTETDKPEIAAIIDIAELPHIVLRCDRLKQGSENFTKRPTLWIRDNYLAPCGDLEEGTSLYERRMPTAPQPTGKREIDL